MKIDTVRAWKDEAYRQSLSDEQRHALPENPVGELDLTDADLQAVVGGDNSFGGAWFSDEEHAYLNSNAFFCENPVFSVNNVHDVIHSTVHITNLCIFVN